MTRAKRLQRLAEERKSSLQYVTLNRSRKLDGKQGFYDSRPVTHRFVVVGEELAQFILDEQRKAGGVTVIDNQAPFDEDQEGNVII